MKLFKTIFFICLAVVFTIVTVPAAHAAKSLVVGSGSVSNLGSEEDRTVTLDITLTGGFDDVNGLAFTLVYDTDIFDFVDLVQDATAIDDGSDYDPDNPPAPSVVENTIYYQANDKSDEDRVLIAAAGVYFFADTTADVVPFKARFRVMEGLGYGNYPISVQKTIIGPDTAANAGYTEPTEISVATGLDPDEPDPTTAESYEVALVAGSITVSGGYTISGLVQYEGPTDADGAVVQLKRKSDGVFVNDDNTAVSSGAFSFSQKPNGEYMLSVTASRPGFQTSYNSSPFTVNSADYNAGTFELSAYSPLTGTINVNGEAIPGMKVKVTQAGVLVGYYTVDSNGHFVTAPLDPSVTTYEITAVYGSEESDPFTGTLDWNDLPLSTLSGIITGLNSDQNAMVHIVSATALLEKTVNLTGTGSPVPYQFDYLLPADNYIVSIVGDGIPVTYYDGVTDITLADPQTVVGGTPTENINFTVSADTADITGQILENSTGVVGVALFAEDAAGDIIGFTLSEENGAYTMTVADGATCIVYAYKSNGKIFFYNSAGTTELEFGAETVTAPPAGAIDINIDEPDCQLAGTVTYRREGGDPVAGILVMAEGPQGSSFDVTNGDGEYTLSGLYCWDDYEVTIYPATPYPPQTVIVQASESETYNFVIHTGWVLSGTVTEEGSPSTTVGNAWIYLVTSGGGIQGVPAISNDDGEFTLADIPAGVYTLALEHPDYLTREYPGLLVQADITEYPATMTLGAAISGTVSDAGGSLEGAKIIANTQGQASKVVFTNGDGIYQLEGLVSGAAYWLVVSKEGYVKQIAAATAPADNVDFTLVAETESVSFSGTVEDSEGNPVDGAIVIVSSEAYDFADATVTADGGLFAFDELIASDDYIVEVLPGNGLPRYEEPIDLTVSVTGRLLTLPGGGITGDVLLSDTAVGASIQVYLLEAVTGNFVSSVIATDNGDGSYTYTFSGIPAGPFVIGAYCAGYNMGWYGGDSFGTATPVQVDDSPGAFTLTVQ